MPNFVAPAFSWGAILFMVPVAIAPAIEHIGDVLTIGNVTRKNYLEKPGLHRTLLGDGLATSAASLLGGPPNTTYSEVTGAVMLTKNFNPKVMWWAAMVAIVLAFVGKFGAALQTIPVPVMGGILCLLFGSIAVVGLNTLIRHQVDLSQSRNLVIVGVTLVFGIGNMALGQLEGIALCAVVAIILNLILPGETGSLGQADSRARIQLTPRNRAISCLYSDPRNRPLYRSRRISGGIGKSGMPGFGPRPLRNWRSWKT